MRDAQAPRDQGFKSLEQIDDLEFPRLAVFAGPNAAGKSNLLDAIQMVARAGTQRTLAEALSKPIRGLPAEAFTLPSGGLAELMDRKLARFELWASLELPSNGRGPERVRYAVRIETEPRGGTLSVDEESLTALSADWLPKGLPRIETANDALLLRRQGQSQPRHEPLHANHTLLSDSRLSGSLYPLFDRVRQELRTWRTYYLDPQDAMREAVGPREVEDIGSRGEHIAPFLYGLKLRQPKAFAAVERSLRAIIPAISGLDVDLDPKRGALDIQIGQDGTLFSSRVVSEGTLRVLALCAIAVTATHGLVAIEEPENGVQPQRLDRIAELLSSTVRRGSAQFVLTTHSPGFVAAMLHRSREASESIGCSASHALVARRTSVVSDLTRAFSPTPPSTSFCRSRTSATKSLHLFNATGWTSEAVSIDVCLFCEDSAHESCARALINRAAAELGIAVSIRIGAARFGIPRLRQELRAFQTMVARSGGTPDILVVMIDANAAGPNSRRREVEALIDNAVVPRTVIGTPDPWVERWLLADPESFTSLFDQQPDLPARNIRVTGRRSWLKRLRAPANSSPWSARKA